MSADLDDVTTFYFECKHITYIRLKLRVPVKPEAHLSERNRNTNKTRYVKPDSLFNIKMNTYKMHNGKILFKIEEYLILFAHSSHTK